MGTVRLMKCKRNKNNNLNKPKQGKKKLNEKTSTSIKRKIIVFCFVAVTSRMVRAFGYLSPFLTTFSLFFENAIITGIVFDVLLLLLFHSASILMVAFFSLFFGSF